MDPHPQITAFLDQAGAHTAQLVRRHRFTVVHVDRCDPWDAGPDDWDLVPGDDGDVGWDDDPEHPMSSAGGPAFGYTVGLFGLGHPELVVVGVGPDEGHDLLDTTARLVVAGRDLLPGEQIDLPGRPGGLVVEHLPNPGDVVVRANEFYCRPDEYSVPALQLTWAHTDGSFPWDPGWPCGPDCQPRPGTWTT
ncbi:DUF4262 domain-containing protein [Modestobacter sp. I12A-02628]|uniref:DUF4262 domain-containing protein n=1 Tax=Goekera deserti TaxID=2497753 RepID=A0A7K3WD75_9ACTN|nr:DUF4262 domain-containing protein [Goekera deserti]MPQ98313.1 DUF4262 domain-containing protein [Goekera deserti]NDI48140.1 DUF4262 domain-containing protein [Goekera deserti]NEL53889.1 DUF4262 domain-containing protein [Goekera deserti]